MRPALTITWTMRGFWTLLLLLLWLPLLARGSLNFFRPGRRVCAVAAPPDPKPESFMQRVYQPYLTTCGHRVCSTYRTIYRTAYRHSRPAPARPRFACCPGWSRSRGFSGKCGPVCQPPCQNGGTCVRPGRCQCPKGWQGASCQADVDECRTEASSCPEHCVNTAGSYWCQSWEGHCPSVGREPSMVTSGPTPEAAAGAGHAAWNPGPWPAADSLPAGAH
ncbi:epidermal growth factor-like protein 7 isoform X3 [Suncus etruscus]|uniref:epidermal growth factor-like protein 7 isoform X3 n=1 Tax=Suncus etruscus TaxID=109475 RepID=UPI0021100928|nr:epidermal growth factor-like protein 7 isoform X3 [Suncus etruscus]